MGQVIPWPKPEERPTRASHHRDGPSGRILLFLGVRYERHAEAVSDGADDGRSAPAAPGSRRAGVDRGLRRRKRG